jgi:hypothetical protein
MHESGFAATGEVTKGPAYAGPFVVQSDGPTESARRLRRRAGSGLPRGADSRPPRRALQSSR